MEQIKGQLPEHLKSTLRIKGAQAISHGVRKMVELQLIDLDRSDAKKFEESMKVSLDLIALLRTHVEKLVVPLFPPHFTMFDAFKEIFAS